MVDVVAGSTRVLRSFNFIFRKFAFLLIVLLIFPVFVELTVSSKAPSFFLFPCSTVYCNFQDRCLSNFSVLFFFKKI